MCRPGCEPRRGAAHPRLGVAAGRPRTPQIAALRTYIRKQNNPRLKSRWRGAAVSMSLLVCGRARPCPLAGPLLDQPCLGPERVRTKTPREGPCHPHCTRKQGCQRGPARGAPSARRQRQRGALIARRLGSAARTTRKPPNNEKTLRRPPPARPEVIGTGDQREEENCRRHARLRASRARQAARRRRRASNTSSSHARRSSCIRTMARHTAAAGPAARARVSPRRWMSGRASSGRARAHRSPARGRRRGPALRRARGTSWPPGTRGTPPSTAGTT